MAVAAGPAERGYRREGPLGPTGPGAHEWVLTNGLGGYAMGTACGVPTRRYHGLLIASMSPPVDRVLALHSLVETVTIPRGPQGEIVAPLAAYRFASGVIHPHGNDHLISFERSVANGGEDACHWTWTVGSAGDGVEVLKSLSMANGANAIRVRYCVKSSRPVRLSVRPLVGLRDHHHLLRKGEAGFEVRALDQRSVRVARAGRELLLAADAGRFISDEQWWHDFAYEQERERGFDYVEDLFSPGRFEVELEGGGGDITLSAAVAALTRDSSGRQRRIKAMVERALEGVEATAGERRDIGRLVAAADQFVVRRVAGADEQQSAEASGVSIIAGYPWFSDWGRDTLISLPGLLLCTGRFDEARRVLETFARPCRRGLVPNLFNDRTGEAEYNTVDASLWFLRAACAYARAAGDRNAFERGGLIRDACLRIIDGYRDGTDYGIRMDADGLIAAGDESTQLTWMDAKRDGVVFTPRHGKAVEINALWHHGLLAVADRLERVEPERTGELRALGERVGVSFRTAFWDGHRGMLYDVLHPAGDGWTPSPHVRPNQIFGVSLAPSLLTREQQAAVVRTVRSRLLTPHGLRTVDPADPGFKGRYIGTMRERDAAYHNGTVWPWLLGPFAEAVMRAEAFSAGSRAEARRLLYPLLARLDGESIGQLPEVFDGEDTRSHSQRPGGCIAQAWSVAETLRVWRLAASGHEPQ